MSRRRFAHWETHRAHLPYVAVFCVGMLLRLVDLGARPLSSAEAAASWAAWSSANGSSVLPLLSNPPQSAALFGLQWMIFWLAGGSDGIARLAPALLSSAVVLLPWILRAALGTIASVTLAALLALDPLAIGYSRVADGAALTSAAGWTVVLCSIAAATPWVSSSLRCACRSAVWIAAGLLICSGPLAWDLLPPLALAVICIHRTLGHAANGGLITTPRSTTIMAVTALVVSTSAFMQSQGPQFVSSSLTRSLQGWLVAGGPSFQQLWTDIVRFEILPLVLGSSGVLLGLFAGKVIPDRDRSPFVFSRAFFTVLSLWIVWSIALTIRPGRAAATWHVLQMPLFLGICYLLSSFAAELRGYLTANHLGSRLVSAVVVVLGLHFIGAGVKVAQDHRGVSFSPYADVTESAVRRLADDLDVPILGGHARVDVVGAQGVDPVLGWVLREQNVRWVAAAIQSEDERRYTLTPSAVGDLGSGDLAAYRLRRQDGNHQLVKLQLSGPSW